MIFPELTNYDYTYIDGIKMFIFISIFNLLISIIPTVMARILMHTKKECLAVFVSNFMVKTILFSIFNLLKLNMLDIVTGIVFFVLAGVIESIIYLKMFKCKKSKSIITAISSDLCFIIIYIFWLLI